MKINKNLINYLNTNLDINFREYFYGIEINQKDIKDFEYYSKAILHKNNKLYPSEISRLLNISKRKIEHWVRDGNKPFIIRLLEHYLILGKPRNSLRWLSINSTRGGLFTGPWMQVPNKVNNYDEVYGVIKQLEELPNFKEKPSELNLILIKKENLFAYFIGILIGDSSKTGIKRKNRTTRRVQIRLSKGYSSNERLGEFVSLCTNSFGLRMKRCKDCPAGRRNVYPFYSWASQSSPLIQWIFSVCLGLNDDEVTTYNPIKLNWILTAPRDFKICFLQGLADSDGFVDFTNQQVGIITEPNTELVLTIFNSLGIKTTKRLFRVNDLWSLMINIKDAYNLPIFNPIVKSYRYEQLEKLFNANRITGHWPLWLRQKIEQNIREGVGGTTLVKKILNEDGIAIRTKNIHKRANKLVS